VGPIGTVSAQQALSLAAPSRLILEIDIRQLLAGAILHDKAGGLSLDRLRRRDAAAGSGGRLD
jgi:hypothetical protein